MRKKPLILASGVTIVIVLIAGAIFINRTDFRTYTAKVNTVDVVLESDMTACIADPAAIFGQVPDRPIDVYGQIGRPAPTDPAVEVAAETPASGLSRRIFGDPEDLYVDLAFSMALDPDMEDFEIQDISVTFPLPFHSTATYELSCKTQDTGDSLVFRKHSPMMLTQNYREPPASLLPKRCLGEEGVVSIRMDNDAAHIDLAAALTEVEFRAVHWNPNSTFTTPSAVSFYLPKRAVVPGETVEIHGHTLNPETPATLEIFRGGNPLSAIRLDDIQLQSADMHAYSYRDGFDWPVAASFDIPRHFQSGYYVAVLTQGKERWSYVFLVKPPVDVRPKAVVVAATNTWNAYNHWGGASFYANEIGKGCLNTDYARIISDVRPDREAFPIEDLTRYSHLSDAERFLAFWMTQNGKEYGVYSDDDLDLDPTLLDGQPLLILPSHPEYYTETMYDRITAHVESGGNILSLGANVLYYRVSRRGPLMEKHENGRLHDLDEEFGGFWSQHLNRSPARILGSEYDARDWNTYEPYEVVDATHPIFEGTELKNGDLFGARGSGLEMDVLQEDTGLDPVLLATGTNPAGYGASMLYVENSYGGKIFSVGSIAYAFGLEQDDRLGIILNNAFKLLANDE